MRKSVTRKTIGASALLTLSVVLLSSFGAEAQNGKSPKELFEATCSQCHSLDVPRGERLTKDGWTDIVARMRSNGCQITDAEAAIIRDYLAKEYGKK
jgi:mono/diheme cytochrome c family protein